MLKIVLPIQTKKFIPNPRKRQTSLYIGGVIIRMIVGFIELENLTTSSLLPKFYKINIFINQ